MTRYRFCWAALIALVAFNHAHAWAGAYSCPHRVAVFAGHTESLRWRKNTSGPKSCTGIFEFQFNDQLIELFARESNKKIEYVLVPSTLNIPRQSRPKLAVSMGASLFVEIHHDSLQWDRYYKLCAAQPGDPMLDYYRGFCLLVYGDEKSVALAKAIEAPIIEAGIRYSAFRHEDVSLRNRMTLIPGTRVTYRREKLFVLRTSEMPAVIVECGVTANPEEEVLLKQNEYRERMVHAIHKGISDYLSRCR